MRTCLWILAGLLLAFPGWAPAADAERVETFGLESPAGRLEYLAGRGLRVGDTGITVGGFATAGAERLEGGESRGGIEGVNPFVFFDPTSFLHVFTELEVSKLGEAESGRSGVQSDPAVKVERLYADVGTTDLLNVRVGQFLTPIGRWNLAPAEPLVWTTSEPVIVEEVFDEIVSGAMAWGAVFPRGASLSYSLYGTFLDPIEPDRDAPPADHSAGARLEWASLDGWSIGASYFASEPPAGDWNHLGGFDALWQPTARIELSTEALFGEGTREEGALWGVYLQGVVETLPTLHAVLRYERFSPPGDGRAVDLVDAGLAWVPRSFLRVKADYRIADRFDELAEEIVEPGFRFSVSVLF